MASIADRNTRVSWLYLKWVCCSCMHSRQFLSESNLVPNPNICFVPVSPMPLLYPPHTSLLLANGTSSLAQSPLPFSLQLLSNPGGHLGSWVGAGSTGVQAENGLQDALCAHCAWQMECKKAWVADFPPCSWVTLPPSLVPMLPAAPPFFYRGHLRNFGLFFMGPPRGGSIIEQWRACGPFFFFSLVGPPRGQDIVK